MGRVLYLPIWAMTALHEPPLATLEKPADRRMATAEALRMPEAQQVTMAWSLALSWLIPEARRSSGMFVAPGTCPPANSPGLRTSRIRAPSARSSLTVGPWDNPRRFFKAFNMVFADLIGHKTTPGVARRVLQVLQENRKSRLLAGTSYPSGI